ncbi:polyprenyl synthetase family protein [Saccharolobus solfataricus]|uniref:Geranylgeranyl diphosphate synthase n=3 Tax=Saccharolobus solfataricus TaxID=2287 RepID=GGPS_SACS2|nr:geranylgeranyl diphosphate synthase [Saccharolobus solfataricus]P95999.2 RecName: Full=Geranylgeranyl diphosphate synthase; Short=GGPP synthase; Short=GGPS [Saccharolobus solfataricus P2]AAK40423.1 Geranylgeranyl pyrophosphate synthetase (gdS-1) [Saccharolobus solfataricus P2]AKA73411.1 polyprenyl synthetase family protein [Saccharolobus solfataricus]AKA76110.1 polyprenyl synthetase family protein [Saccharolobus solfataricus]AKA78802.1 polyprenyl synthetase family protein [Saccharolobus sol
MSSDDLSLYFNEIVNNVNFRIKNFVKSNFKTLEEASFHLFTAGGKRLRPLVLVSSSDLIGGDRERAYKAAAAVEILHNFTLVHDDIMDNDGLRRGLPTVHVKWGEPMAILAGDYLHAKAFEALNEALKGLDGNTFYKAFSIFITSIEIISEGQAMDMSFENRLDVTEEEYIQMIKGKTAMLFSCSAALGGIINKANDDVVKKLTEYGLNLGISFQIVDDILGIIGDEKELGKPIYSDIREGKKTILVIKTLSEATEDEKKILVSTLGNKEAKKEDLERASEIIRKHSLQYAYDLAKKYSDLAIENLREIPVSNKTAEKALKYLAQFTIQRRK